MVNSYVAIDLETTGLDPKRDKIIEIGACRVEEGEITDRYETFVNPRRQLPEQIEELTRISGVELERAPGIEEVIGPVLDFIGDFPILGHHIIFDYSFLKRAAVNNGLVLECGGIDTLALCRKFMPEGEKKGLAPACGYFGIPVGQSHRALSDARAAHLLYQELKGAAPLPSRRHFQ